MKKLKIDKVSNHFVHLFWKKIEMNYLKKVSIINIWPQLLEWKKKFQTKYPSAVHVDGTSRPQFVEQKDNEKFFKILKEYKSLNEHGILINTSFNKHGRTIVNTINRAVEDFIDCDIDILYVENFLITKKIKE